MCDMHKSFLRCQASSVTFGAVQVPLTQHSGVFP
jgi:hypothetical protein